MELENNTKNKSTNESESEAYYNAKDKIKEESNYPVKIPEIQDVKKS